MTASNPPPSYSALIAGAPAPVSLGQVVADGFALRAYGFIGDGNSHPLSGINTFGANSTSGWTLTQWQAIFPFATALTNEIDGLAVQALINSFAATQAFIIQFPACTWRSSLTIKTGGGNAQQGAVTIKGAGQNVTIMNVVTAGITGWQHNYGQNPDLALANFQMSDMAVMVTGAGTYGLDITVTTASTSGLTGGFGCLIDRVNVLGYRTTTYVGNYWHDPIIIRGGGGSYLTEVNCGDGAATYSLNSVGDALTFNGANSAGADDIGVTCIFIDKCNFTNYNIGIYFYSTSSYGIQGTWVQNSNFNCYQALVYDATAHASGSFPSPQNFILSCQAGGGYGGNIVATGISNFIIRNFTGGCAALTIGNPTGATLHSAYQFNSCYNVVVDACWFENGQTGLPYIFDCDQYCEDILIKDTYFILPATVGTLIRTQNGAARIKERNSTFQSNVTPTTVWVNGNATKNGCIIESWINLFNNTAAGTGTRCTVDNLGTITYSTAQIATTSSTGVFAAAIPSRNSINLFDTLSVVSSCGPGNYSSNSDPAVVVASSISATGFNAQIVGLSSAVSVQVNFTAVGF